jgi:uncharacterized membrane protein YdjX (TVP38/TMEM64 family)
MRTAGCDHLPPPLGRYPGAETVSALAHQLARLIGPFHVAVSGLRRYGCIAHDANVHYGANRLALPLEIEAAYTEAALFRQFGGCRLGSLHQRFMSIDDNLSSSPIARGRSPFRLRRLAPLVAIGAISIVVIAMGWHRELSFETLARHHDALRHFIAAHETLAIAGYIALYIAVVALSLPIGAYLTVIGGILFGAVLGGTAAVIGASIGAILIFSIARSAFGEHLARRAGASAEKIAEGFRKDAFSYLLFLRLIPVFPFWLVNLVSAAGGVRLAPFAAATVLGIIPATFAFAFVGSGLESVIAAHQTSRAACVASGQPDCPFVFHTTDVLTPRLLAALVALGVLALVPVAVRRLRCRHSTNFTCSR